MFFRDYEIKIEELESALQLIRKKLGDKTQNVSSSLDDWENYSVSLTLLGPLAESLQDAMFILKPEMTGSIKKSYIDTKKTLEELNSTISEKKNHSDSSQELDQLRNSLRNVSVFLDLAKKIKNNPSPVIEEFIKLKEMYDAKEYISTVRAPEILDARLRHLVRTMDTFNRSLANLEKSVKLVKNRLDAIQEESKKFRSISIELLERNRDIPDM